jgi:hypothetical protein
MDQQTTVIENTPAPAWWNNMLVQLGIMAPVVLPEGRVSHQNVVINDNSPSLDDLFIEVFG